MASVIEFMAEAEPLLLYESLETLNGTIMRVENQRGKRAGLRRAVPAIWAVHQYTSTF